MLKDIYNTDGIKVDISNKIIYDKNGVAMKSSNDMYTIEIYDKPITQSLDWFVNMAKYEINVLVDFKESISEITFQFPAYVYSERYAVLAQFKNGIPYLRIGDGVKLAQLLYPRIPEYEHVLVSPNGDLYTFNSENKITLLRRYTPLKKYKDYPGFGFTSTGNVKYYVHRLVAHAWLYNNDFYNKYQIDHLDMNVSNASVSNLEWVTPGDNMQRMAATRISENRYNSQAYAVSVKHKDSKEVINYFSIGEMARELCLKQSAEYIYKSAKLGTLYNGYEIRVAGDDREWYYKTGKEIPIPMSAQRLFILTRGNESVTLFTTVQLAKFFNVGRIYNNGPGIYDFVKNRGWILKIIDLNVGDKDIEVKNIETNEISKFKSIPDAAKFMNAPYDLVNKRIRYKLDTVLVNDIYLVRIASDAPWKEPKKYNNTKPVKIEVTSPDGTVNIFESKAKAAIFIGTNRKTFRKKLKEGVEYNGYKFREI